MKEKEVPLKIGPQKEAKSNDGPLSRQAGGQMCRHIGKKNRKDLLGLQRVMQKGSRSLSGSGLTGVKNQTEMKSLSGST